MKHRIQYCLTFPEDIFSSKESLGIPNHNQIVNENIIFFGQLLQKNKLDKDQNFQPTFKPIKVHYLPKSFLKKSELLIWELEISFSWFKWRAQNIGRWKTYIKWDLSFNSDQSNVVAIVEFRNIPTGMFYYFFNWKCLILW